MKKDSPKKDKFDYKKYIKESFERNITIKFDMLVIAHFFGRWMPFAIAVGLITGSIASLMDLLIININSFLSTNIILILIYPLIISVIVGLFIIKDKDVEGPGIGYSILHLKSKKYIKFKTLIYKLFLAVLALSGGFIAGREGPSFFLGVGIGEWLGKAYGLGKKYS